MESESELCSMDDEFTEEQKEEEPKLPVIVPVDEPQPRQKHVRTYTRARKTDHPYTVSEKVIERNRKQSQRNMERRKEEKRKLAEYEKLLQERSLTRDEADRLLNEKLEKFEERIASKVRVQIPKIEPIAEEPQGYTSDSQRRFSSRFKMQPTSPSGYDRFKRF